MSTATESEDKRLEAVDKTMTCDKRVSARIKRKVYKRLEDIRLKDFKEGRGEFFF